MICHPNGCDQCCADHFKPDWSAPCISCSDYDPNARHCTDFIGSQQCKEDGWTLENYTYKINGKRYKLKRCTEPNK